MKARCGAKTRGDGTCRKPAGWGTDHPGSGKCRLHGGASLSGTENPAFEHGRYSKVVKGKIAKKLGLVETGDPTDLLPELEIQRVLFSEYISRFEESIPITADDIQRLIGWADDIGRMTERIVKMRNQTALTGAEVAFLAARVADVVAKYIDGADKQRAFIDELFGGIKAEDRNTPLLASGVILDQG